MPTIAFLIPSRKRFDGLLRMLRSLREHPDSDEIEIRVWLDDDDNGSLDRKDELSSFGVLLHTGNRLQGYDSTSEFCTIMARETTCPWICIGDDDNELIGCPFVETLKAAPKHGVFFTPEFYHLGKTIYTDFYQYGIVPNNSWKIASPKICQPTDYFLHDALVRRNKWAIQRLKGLTMVHHWDPKSRDKRN